MIKFNRIATENDIKIRQQQTLAFLGYKQEQSESKAAPLRDAQPEPEPGSKPGSKWKETDGPVLDYLYDVHVCPDMNASERDKECGYSPRTGTQMRNILAELELIECHKEKRNGGRPAQIWKVTGKGLEALIKSGRVRIESDSK